MHTRCCRLERVLEGAASEVSLIRPLICFILEHQEHWSVFPVHLRGRMLTAAEYGQEEALSAQSLEQADGETWSRVTGRLGEICAHGLPWEGRPISATNLSTVITS